MTEFEQKKSSAVRTSQRGGKRLNQNAEAAYTGFTADAHTSNGRGASHRNMPRQEVPLSDERAVHLLWSEEKEPVLTEAYPDTAGKDLAPQAQPSAPKLSLWGRVQRAYCRWRDSDATISPAIPLFEAGMRKARWACRRWHHIVGEKRKRNFPESERMTIQLLLFGWSMLPLTVSYARDAFWQVRHQISQQFMQLRSKLIQRQIHPAMFMGAGAAVVVLALLASTYTLGTTVSYDGEEVAAVSSRSDAREVRQELETITARTLGQEYTISDDLLHYSTGLLPRESLSDPEELEEGLSQEIGLVAPAYCLYINGERLGATPHEGALDELLSQLIDSATNEDTISCDFAEDVEIKYEYVPTSEILNLGYLAETLYSTKTAEVTYTVVKGDTWSQIANSHGLSSKELLDLNPGYNIDRLQIGEELTLSASVPYLTMTVVQQERYVDEVNYDIEYTDSANLYKGDYKVTSPGVYGAADVVANVTYVNGQETDRTVLSSVLLREPVTEQRLQGTKERPSWLPTGHFRWPVSGRITSNFGPRRSPGGIGSRNHKGIDIGAPRGTPVYASDGGTVTYAGWMGGYGYLVEINHGNGYVTRYGHNSSLTVSKGQHVYPGQQIARVGSTGNSTGNHCHFEIRYHGVPKNPRNFLS